MKLLGSAIFLFAVLTMFDWPAQGAKRASKVDEGPGLGYPCVLVRWYASGKSHTELEALGRAHGISPKQRREAIACLNGG